MVRIGRNELCPCGSGRKYKRCCLGKDVAAQLKAAPEAIDERASPPETPPYVLVKFHRRSDEFAQLITAAGSA